MSGYDWQPEHDDDRERAREWDRADQLEHAETVAHDRLTRDVGEGRSLSERGSDTDARAASVTRGPDPVAMPRSESDFPSSPARRTCQECGEWFYSWGAHAERCARGGP